MSIEQLPIGEAYPNARNAISAIGNDSYTEGRWAIVRKMGLSVERIISGLIRILRQRGQPEIASEMETADFRRYVAGKLGMM